jgi:hypothetical protein
MRGNNLSPGCELDELIAEKIMGWTRYDQHPSSRIQIDPELTRVSMQYFDQYDYLVDRRPWWVPLGSRLIDATTEIPNYSTDISAAWELVEKLRRDHKAIVIHSASGSLDAHSIWSCEVIYGDHVIEQFGKTAPHAICLAALKAVG